MSHKTKSPNLLQDALKYLSQGLPVIPLQPKGKKPLVPWQEYQKRLPTEEEVKEWWDKWPDANIGIVTGKGSGLVVVDVDGEKGLETAKGLGLPEGPTVKTGRGYHHYFRHPGNAGVSNFQCKAGLEGIDLRGDGGYVVAPPSVHPSGETYRWVIPLGSMPLATLPESLLLVTHDGKPPVANLFKGVPEGRRNNALASIAGILFAKELDYGNVLKLCLAWNERNNPPLAEREVQATVKSIHKAHQKNNNGQELDWQFGNPIERGETAILRVTSLGEIYKAPPPSWLIEGLILENAVTMLNAYAKDGKTYLTMEIARCVVTGEALFGFSETKQGTVLMVDSENSWPLLKGRYEKLGVTEELPIKYLSFQPVRLDTESGIEALKETVMDINPVLVIFDTLTRFHRKKENEAGEMALVMETLRDLANSGHTILLLHHRRKGEGREEEMVRGSGDILASVDNLLTLKKDHDTFVLSFTTGRLNGLQKPIRYKIEQEEERITLQYQGEVLSREDEILKALRQVLESGEMGVRDIYDKINSNGLTVGEKKLRVTLKKYEGKEFKIHKSRHNKTVYGIK